MKETQQVIYTPRKEFNCGWSEGSTHYQGCQCHEAAWALKLRESETREHNYKMALAALIENAECREDEDCDHCFAVATIENPSGDTTENEA